MIKFKLSVIITIAAFVVTGLISCGKKDDQPQTQQVTPPDTLKQAPQNQQVTQNQTKTDSASNKQKEDDKKKDDDKKKEDDKKKADEKLKDDKRKADSILKVDSAPKTTSDDFSAIWNKRCVKCHGKDGTGKVEGVPNLTSVNTKKKSEAQLIKIITGGVKSDDPDGEDMPSFKGKLTDEEIQAAANWVKGL